MKNNMHWNSRSLVGSAFLLPVTEEISKCLVEDLQRILQIEIINSL